MSKVIVTGANGFLGSWVTRTLVEQGHEVFALVREKSDLSELQGVECQYLYGDVTDSHSLEKPFHGMDSVFHLAGLIAYTPHERKKMELVNVEGTQNVVDAVQSQDVRKLVHLSSVVAVGAGFRPEQVLNEESEYNIAHLNLGYFETKRKAEQIVVEATKARRIDSVILNPSTIYGRGDARKGSRGTQLKVAQGKFPLYPPGGANVVAVEDVVDGILKAWAKGRSGERYILSSENLLLKDIFNIIAETAKVPAPHIALPGFAIHALGFVGDILNKYGKKFPINSETAWTSTLYHWFDSSKAQKELGFAPRPARIAIENSVQWIQEHGLLTLKK